jgi:hypothetical protein
MFSQHNLHKTKSIKLKIAVIHLQAHALEGIRPGSSEFQHRSQQAIYKTLFTQAS